jgi:hypothetical protein
MTITAGTEMSGSRSCWTWVAASEQQHHAEDDDDPETEGEPGYQCQDLVSRQGNPPDGGIYSAKRVEIEQHDRAK